MQVLINMFWITTGLAMACAPLWGMMLLAKFLEHRYKISLAKSNPVFAKCMNGLGAALQGVCEVLEIVLAGLLGVACAHFIRQSNASYRKELYKDPKRY